MLRTLISHTGKCLAAATMMFVAQPAAQADVFDAFDSLQPVSTYFGECCESLDLGGDTCCTGSCCDCCCTCPPAPTMIGDSLGIPLIVRGATDINFYPQFYSRVADNNSAIPQDRVYFNFKYINDIPVTRDRGQNAPNYNADFQYYELGLEKTFMEGNLSAELILPFTYGPDSLLSPAGDAAGGPEGNNAQLQDIAFGIKALLTESDTTAFSVGLRVEAPTSKNLDINAAGPTQEFTNDVWSFTPYAAVLVTPTDDLFFQAFAAYRMQSSDNQHLRQNGANAYREPNYFNLDAQLGYWLHRNTGGEGLTGLQAKIEAHYTGTFEPGIAPAPVAGRFVGTGGEHDVLNLTAGLTALLNDNATVTTAFVVPLREGSLVALPPDGGTIRSDKQFDWEFVAQFNYYFGN